MYKDRNGTVYLVGDTVKFPFSRGLEKCEAVVEIITKEELCAAHPAFGKYNNPILPGRVLSKTLGIEVGFEVGVDKIYDFLNSGISLLSRKPTKQHVDKEYEDLYT